MSEEILEKRRFSRKVPEEPAQVLDRATGQVMGVLEDVSRGGFSLLTQHPVRLSDIRHVTMMLPAPNESVHEVSMMVECVWCQSGNKQGDHGKDYAAGFQLRSIEEQDAVALNYFMRDF